MWGVMTKQMTGTETRVSKINCCQVEWLQKDGSASTGLSTSWKLKELPGTEFTLDANIVILALGFLHVSHQGLIADLGLDLNQRGDVAVANFQTSQPWVFAAGDTINGASLVVRAIDSGRNAAVAIDRWLREN
jgi:NADPH-dependent glutamate synthase beta subunit-like oxidoreductase